MGKPRMKSVPGRQHKKQNDPFKVKNAGKKLKSSRKRVGSLFKGHTCQPMRLTCSDLSYLEAAEHMYSKDSKEGLGGTR